MQCDLTRDSAGPQGTFAKKKKMRCVFHNTNVYRLVLSFKKQKNKKKALGQPAGGLER